MRGQVNENKPKEREEKKKPENKTMGLRNSKELQDNKKDEEEKELHHHGGRQCGNQKETQDEQTRGLDCLGKGEKREKEGKNVQTPITVPCSDWGRPGRGAGGTTCRKIGL